MRIYRELSPTTRAKISEKMKGRHKTDKHKAAIRRGMLRYWENVPHVIEVERNNESKEPLNNEQMEETSND